MTDTIDIDAPERTALTHTAKNTSLTPDAAPTVRNAMMSLPVEQQSAVLAEYKDRRENFRAWLFKQLQRGVHYGDVPGVRKNGDDRNWKARPSLYKAGAELLCDLNGLRAEFTPEHIPGGHQDRTLFCFCCRLYDTAGTLIGEGRGAMGDGEKKMMGNSAIKMAQKRAHVDATITSLGVSDLFTQDPREEDPAAPTITAKEADGLTKLCDALDAGKTGAAEGETYRELINARKIERIEDLPAKFYGWASNGLARRLAEKLAEKGGAK